MSTSRENPDPVLAAIERLTKEIGTLRSEMTGEIGTLRSEMTARFDRLEEEGAVLRADLTTLGKNVDSIRREARADMAVLRVDLGADVALLHADIQAATEKVATTGTETNTKLDAVLDELRHLRARADADHATIERLEVAVTQGQEAKG
jgi:hypothetical protein